MQPLLFAGPQLSLVRRVRQTVAGQATDISDQIVDVDTGVAAGGGLEVTVGRGALVFDARVVIGLRQLNEAAPPEFKSRAFTLLAGYRF